jgi:ferredoxin
VSATRLRIDGALCSGHGRCYSVAPDVYAPDDEGYVEGRDVDREIEPADIAQADEGARSCPEQAIVLS